MVSGGRRSGALVALATVLALLTGCGSATSGTPRPPAGDLTARIEAFLGRAGRHGTARPRPSWWTSAASSGTSTATPPPGATCGR
jgi:hypothetical protein